MLLPINLCLLFDVVGALLKIAAWFDWIIYELVSYSYTLFAIMCKLDFSSLSEVLSTLVDRMQVFIGIVMLFVVAFNLLQFLADVSKLEKGAGELVKKIAVSLILLVSANFIFEILDDFQRRILDNSTIEKIIFGINGEASNVSNQSEYNRYLGSGRWVSYTVFFSFFDPGDDALKVSIFDGDTNFKDMVDRADDDSTSYRYPIISGVCGIFLIVMFATFAIDIGIRAFNLLILQIIMPVAVMSNIVPKGEAILNKYIKTYISTYIQLFIKIFISYIIIYLMMFTMTALLGNGAECTSGSTNCVAGAANFFNDNSVIRMMPPIMKILLLIIIFFSLFQFFKSLPKLAKSIFGVEIQGGSAALKNTGAIVAGGLGLGVGAIGGLKAGISGKSGGWGTIKSTLKGAKGGLTSGASAGKKGNIKEFMSSQKTNQKALNEYASGLGAKRAAKINRKEAEVKNMDPGASNSGNPSAPGHNVDSTGVPPSFDMNPFSSRNSAYLDGLNKIDEQSKSRTKEQTENDLRPNAKNTTLPKGSTEGTGSNIKEATAVEGEKQTTPNSYNNGGNIDLSKDSYSTTSHNIENDSVSNIENNNTTSQTTSGAGNSTIDSYGSSYAPQPQKEKISKENMGDYESPDNYEPVEDKPTSSTNEEEIEIQRQAEAKRQAAEAEADRKFQEEEQKRIAEEQARAEQERKTQMIREKEAQEELLRVEENQKRIAEEQESKKETTEEVLFEEENNNKEE